MAEAQQARYQARTGNPKATFVVRNHPIPLTRYEEWYIQSLLSLFASLFLLVPFCYLPASFSMFVVRERVIKHKHLLLVSGTRSYIYWSATYAFDMCQFTVVIA